MRLFLKYTALWLGISTPLLASVTADTIVDALGELVDKTTNTGLKQRLTAVQTMLGTPEILADILPYKLNRMNTLVTDDSDSTSLKTLVQAGTVGHPGDPTSTVTAYGRLNALAEIVTQSTLTDKLGSYTDVALQNGRSMWSQLKWILEEFDLQLQNQTLEQTLQGWCQVGLEQLQFDAQSILNAPENSALQTTMTGLVQWAAAGSDQFDMLFMNFKNANPKLGTYSSYSDLIAAFTTYQWLQSFENNEASHTEVPSLVEKLQKTHIDSTEIQNSLKKIQTLASFHSSPDSTGGKALKAWLSHLGTADDVDSRQPFTVCSQIHKLQSDLHGCVSLFTADRITSLTTQYQSLTSALKTLQTATLAYLEGVGLLPTDEEPQGISSQISAMLTSLQEIVKTDIVSLTPSINTISTLPTAVLTQFSNISSVVTAISDQVSLADFIRTATHTWPLVAERVTSATNQVVKSVYTGQYVQPGLTLVNCLENLYKIVFLDPTLHCLGKSELNSHSSTLLGKIAQQNPPLDASIQNTLVLLSRMFEQTPSLAFEVDSASTPLHQVLSTALGSRTDATDASWFGAFQTAPEKLSSQLTTFKTQLNSVVQNLAGFSEKLPNQFDRLDFWLDYGAVEAATHNSDTIDSATLNQVLFSSPLVGRLTGIPSVTDPSSWQTQVLESISNPGTINDCWFWSKAKQTPLSVLNFAAHILESGTDLLSQTQTSNSLFARVLSIVSNSMTSAGLNSLYERLTLPFIEQIQDFMKASADALEGSIATLIPSDSGLYKKLQQCQNALSACTTSLYPVNLATVLYKLSAVQNGLPNTAVDSDALQALANLGEDNDHPADTTLFGLLNGILYECGAQLLLNLIGSIVDPGLENFGTLYSSVRKAEMTAKTQTLSSTETDALSANLTSLRQALSVLRGTISYFYPSLLVSSSSFDSTLEALSSSAVLNLTAADLTRTYTQNDTTPWDHLTTLARTLTEAFQKP